MKGITGVLKKFGHEQHPSNNINPWCLIIKYPNDGIGFLVGFGFYVISFHISKICYGAQCISKIPLEGYCTFIKSLWARTIPL